MPTRSRGRPGKSPPRNPVAPWRAAGHLVALMEARAVPAPAAPPTNPLTVEVTPEVEAILRAMEARARVQNPEAHAIDFNAPPGQRPRLIREFPRGIPAELVPFFEAVNEVMADQRGFALWLIALDRAVSARLQAHPSETPIQAIQAVIRGRATAAGWGADVLVLERLQPERAWRPMLSKGKLFIDTYFNDTVRGMGLEMHTEGAHLLQLLYLSETLNARGLRPPAGSPDGNVVQTMMRFMGDSYLVDGAPFQTRVLDWSDTGVTDSNNRYLWRTFFDNVTQTTNTPNRPEVLGSYYHALTHLPYIELWSASGGPEYDWRAPTQPPPP